jgi:peptidoglycan hydrolase-like protein with peptidoglycan-binding domain
MTVLVDRRDITFADLKRQMDLLDGYTGSKADDNRNKIWRDLEPTFQGASYCAAGDCYIWKHAGHPFPAIDHPWGFSYCPDAVIWAKKNGLWSASGHYEPGDTTLYDWEGDGVSDHTGTMVHDDGGSPFLDFECNTTPENVSGDQSNGGGCYYRHRSHGPTVMGVLKSSRWLVDHPHHVPVPDPRAHQRKANPFDLNMRALPLRLGDGHLRYEPVEWAQWALSIPVDGMFGTQTQRAVRLFQKVHGLHIDGIIGPQTAAVLNRVTH